MAHTSRLTFRTHGGACAGEQWIYDHDEPIARFHRSCVEQPEQNLRYFDKVLNPVELRDIRLVPGGRPLFAGAQLYWKLGPVITTELLSVQATGQDSDRLTLTVVTQDPGGVATSTRVVTVQYCPETGSYVYDIRAELLLHSPEVFDQPGARNRDDPIRFEYCDPWYTDVPAPTVSFAGAWPKRHQRLLAELSDGSVWQMPLNHMATGIPSPQAFRPDGRFVLAHDPGNDPAIQFVGDTAGRTSASVCNWGYDIHLVGRYAVDQLYAPICEEFRLCLCPDGDARDLVAAAAPVPAVEFNGFAELPAYERNTSFARGMRLDEPSPGPCDPWPWLPAGEGAEWCRTQGRSDNSSLKIDKRTAGPTEWCMNREGDGAWTEKWTASTGFRVSVYVKTEDVAGRGAFLALRWAVFNYPERYPYVCSEKLVGSHDWTRLTAEIRGPAPAGISAIAIMLRQDGPGTTWFDDLSVEPL